MIASLPIVVAVAHQYAAKPNHLGLRNGYTHCTLRTDVTKAFMRVDKCRGWCLSQDLKWRTRHNATTFTLLCQAEQLLQTLTLPWVPTCCSCDDTIGDDARLLLRCTKPAEVALRKIDQRRTRIDLYR